MACTPSCRVNLKKGNNTIGHCALCHKDFSGLTAFDFHFGRHEDGRVFCKDLTSLHGWVDDKGIFHKGDKMTAEQIEKIWGEQ